MYNQYHDTLLTPNQFAHIDKKIAIIEMLRSENIDFLREMLPHMLNQDFSKMEPQQLKHHRDMNLKDYERVVGYQSSDEKRRINVQDNRNQCENILKNLRVSPTLNFDTTKAELAIDKMDFDSLYFAVYSMEQAFKKENAAHLYRHGNPLLSRLFIPGKHSRLIKEFVDKLNRIWLNAPHMELSAFKKEVNQVLSEFQKKLTDGNSIRTAAFLDHQMKEQFKPSFKHAIASRQSIHPVP